MKLTVTVALLLVTVSVFCNLASAEMCPAFLEVLKTLINDSVSAFEATLDAFDLDNNARSAGLKMKLVMNMLPQEFRNDLQTLVDQMANSQQCQ